MGKLNHYQRAMLDAALRYAEQGRAVLPVARSRKPINANGSREATTDPQRITAWWETHPTAQIGIATGAISGIWVVDVDMENGRDGIQALKSEFGEHFIWQEEKLSQKMPTNGLQFVFAWDDARPVHGVQNILEGVDLRGEGDFIVATPSSFNVDGEWITYRWNDAAYHPVEAPEWAWMLAGRAQDRVSMPVDLNAALHGVHRGSRGNDLFRIACMLRDRDVSQATAITFIEMLAERCRPPFDVIEAREKVETAYSRYRTLTEENSLEEVTPSWETA